MCPAPKIKPMAAAPAPPPTLDQLAPKSATSTSQKNKREGLSRYQFDTKQATGTTTSLAGISKKSTLAT